MIASHRSFHRRFWMVAAPLLLLFLAWLVITPQTPAPLNDIPPGSEAAALPLTAGQP